MSTSIESIRVFEEIVISILPGDLTEYIIWLVFAGMYFDHIPKSNLWNHKLTTWLEYWITNPIEQLGNPIPELRFPKLTYEEMNIDDIVNAGISRMSEDPTIIRPLVMRVHCRNLGSIFAVEISLDLCIGIGFPMEYDVNILQGMSIYMDGYIVKSVPMNKLHSVVFSGHTFYQHPKMLVIEGTKCKKISFKRLPKSEIPECAYLVIV